MFESATQAHKIDKKTFKAKEEKLRAELLDAQFDLIEQKGFAVLIVLAGIDGAGKSAVLARLGEWFDPRHVQTAVFDEPSREAAARPPFWRFWRELPAKGKIGIFVGSWYREAIRHNVLGNGTKDRLERDVAAVNRFEAMLADEGLLVIKLWLHLSPADHKKRMKEIDKLPGGGRHVVEHRQMHKHADQLMPVLEDVVRRTSSGDAPWVVVPSADEEYRDLTIGETVLAAIRKRLDAAATPKTAAAPVIVAGLDRKTALDALDLGAKLDAARYDEKLVHYQHRLAELTDSKAFRDVALIGVFEGNDAAGKGGTIRRVTRALDPRRFKVHPIAAPSDEERAQPYLWRFWRRLPAKGQTAIFDRSWYGRVLVERVEGFCSEADWLRAYAEINDFEDQLHASGAVVVKFWLAISKDEQLRRFQDRENTPYKRYKITDEDWRNREKWDAYVRAVGDMVDRTSTEQAPWTLVASEDKNWARVQVLKTLTNRLAAALS